MNNILIAPNNIYDLNYKLCKYDDKKLENI